MSWNDGEVAVVPYQIKKPSYAGKYWKPLWLADYKGREFKITDKAKKYIGFLLEELGEDGVDDYTEWWLDKKAPRMNGFNIGLFCCKSMVEEYLVRNKKIDFKGEIQKQMHLKRAKAFKSDFDDFVGNIE